jgi:hypothetical protein
LLHVPLVLMLDYLLLITCNSLGITRWPSAHQGDTRCVLYLLFTGEWVDYRGDVA